MNTQFTWPYLIVFPALHTWSSLLSSTDDTPRNRNHLDISGCIAVWNTYPKKVILRCLIIREYGGIFWT